MLACKMSYYDKEWLKIVNELFKKGASTKLKDKSGWKPIQEAISQQNTNLLALLFEWTAKNKKINWAKNKLKISERLKKIPDFYVEINWDCESKWIPFLSKIAPSDTLQIWKVGDMIRLDFSLVGFQKLKNKRRHMSIIFKNDEKYRDQQIFLINRHKKTVVDPLEEMD